MKRSRNESATASGKIVSGVQLLGACEGEAGHGRGSEELGPSPWDGFGEDSAVEEEVLEEDVEAELAEEDVEEMNGVVKEDEEVDDNEWEVEEEEVVDEEEKNGVVVKEEEEDNDEEVEEEEVVDDDDDDEEEEAGEGGASGTGSGSGSGPGGKVKGREKQYVTYTEVPMPSPPPLDRSLYIPRGVMVPPYTEGMETMREFVCRVSVGMAATGLARCTLKVPSLADVASVEPESLLASKDLLEKALGKAYKMRSYSYTFDKSTDTEVPGSYTLKYNRKEPTYTASKFFARSFTEEAQGPFSSLPREGAFSDRAYWQGVEACVADGFTLHYPSDVDASLISLLPDFPVDWDLSKFTGHNELLRALVPYLGFKENKIPGYTTPMIYVGGPGTTFALHAEDQNLFSCNYLLAGCPKVWYSVPPQYYTRVIEFVHRRAFLTNPLVKSCPQAVMHKRFLVHPEELHAAGIPTSRIIQYPGDMVITHPGSFHFGYNAGWNIAEASNFATELWWKGGHFHDSTSAGDCKCKESTRFAFDDDEIRVGLKAVGAKFGIYREDL